MKLLISPSNPRFTLVLLDLHSGDVEFVESVPEQAQYPRTDLEMIDTPHRPFGITWIGRELYLTNRRNLLRFDSHLRYTGIHYQGLCANPHQIVARDGDLFVASPRIDGILRLRGDHPTQARYFDPLNGWGSPVPAPIAGELDNHHYNALVFHGQRLYVLSHNKGTVPSDVLMFDAVSMAPLGRTGPLGTSSHNLCVEPEGVVTLDTGATRCLIRSDGLRIPLGAQPQHFIRGLAVSDEHYFIGMFERHLRHYRSMGGSVVIVVDRKSRRVIDKLHIPDIGAINDMRLIDVVDHAHGVAPFWQSTRFIAPACADGPGVPIVS